MARPARPWYRASRKQWFVQVGGKQVGLGVTDPKAEVEAWAAFRKLAAAGSVGDGRTVAETVAAFLDDAGRRVKPHTLKVYAWYLSRWVARSGREFVHAALLLFERT